MIPRIFHCIWLGPVKMPSHFSSWIGQHPNWELRLWKRADLMKLQNEHTFCEARTYSEKSDVWRYELLNRFGGVYLDTDFECLRPLDELVEDLDCFAATQDGSIISTGMLGAVPGHPLVRAVVNAMPVGFPRSGNPDENSGPRWFTKLVEKENFRSQITVFPQTLFYPLVYGDRDNPPEDLRAAFPQAYAVHHWHHSWSGGANVGGEVQNSGNSEDSPTICNAKLSEELHSFADSWRGGYCNDIDHDQERNLSEVVKKCIHGNLGQQTVLEIGPGRGAWTKKIIAEKPRHIYCLDALSADHNGFWRRAGEEFKPLVDYYQVSDFECAQLPNESIDFLFSFDAFCHISLTGVRQYLKNLFQKLKPGAEAYVMFADALKYVRHSGWNGWVQPGDGIDVESYDGAARAERWYWIGIDRFCQLLKCVGYEVLARDIDVTPRDPICHFRRPQPTAPTQHDATLSSGGPSKSPAIAMVSLAYGDEYLRLADLVNPRKQAYCRQRGYRFVDKREPLDPTRHPVWNKLLAVQEALSESEWVFWSDIDTVLWNEAVKLENFIDVDEKKQLIIQENHEGLNAGLFFLRQSPWSFEFLEHLLSRRDLEEHPWREQQAMIEAREDPRWGDAYLVHPYLKPYEGFHGYWYFEDWDKLFLHFAGFDTLRRASLMHNTSRLAAYPWDHRLLHHQFLGRFLNRFSVTGVGAVITEADSNARLSLAREWQGNLRFFPSGSYTDIELSEGALDFVVYEAEGDRDSLEESLRHWIPKIRPGGVIAGFSSERERIATGMGQCCSVIDIVNGMIGVEMAVTMDEDAPLWYAIAP